MKEEHENLQERDEPLLKVGLGKNAECIGLKQEEGRWSERQRGRNGDSEMFHFP